MRLVTLQGPTGAAEIAADRLWAAGARAVEETTLDDGMIELRTSLGSDDADARHRLGELPDGWTIAFVDVDDHPAETWRQFARSIEVNARLVIRPAWLPPTDRAGVLDVPIEPGGSFGLGDHPTTRLSAAAADLLVVPGARVADLGCGSGVLAVIAALRGAGRVVATDIAEAAREATVANAERNGVDGIVEASTTPIGELTGTFDLVLANILAPTLIELAADLRRLTDRAGRLVISGVLSGGYEHVVVALEPMQVIDERDLDGWSAVTLAHPG